MLDGLEAWVSRIIRPNALTRSHSSTSWIGSSARLRPRGGRSSASRANWRCQWRLRSSRMLAASRNSLYSNRRRTSSWRGSSNSSWTSSARGSTCCDLISMSVAATARKSPTASTSNCSSTARYSRYWSVIVAIGMSTISTSCLRTRYRSRSSGPRKTLRSTRKSILMGTDNALVVAAALRGGASAGSRSGASTGGNGKTIVAARQRTSQSPERRQTPPNRDKPYSLPACFRPFGPPNLRICPVRMALL